MEVQIIIPHDETKDHYGFVINGETTALSYKGRYDENVGSVKPMDLFYNSRYEVHTNGYECYLFDFSTDELYSSKKEDVFQFEDKEVLRWFLKLNTVDKVTPIFAGGAALAAGALAYKLVNDETCIDETPDIVDTATEFVADFLDYF